MPKLKPSSVVQQNNIIFSNIMSRCAYFGCASEKKAGEKIGMCKNTFNKRKHQGHWKTEELVHAAEKLKVSVALLQNPTEKNATVRHAIITGETGEYDGYRKNTRMKLSQKWLELFGGYENEKEGVNYKIPDFKVSNKCCYYLKEKPCGDWAKKHNSVPYLGLMASEGGRRQKSLMINGCNYFGATTVRSAPFAIFSRQDLLQLALDLNVPVPEIYGKIERKPDGTLYTTRAQRTGCSFCGFGIQLEKRPHRFDRLHESNPKEWDFWMNKMGWGHFKFLVAELYCVTMPGRLLSFHCMDLPRMKERDGVIGLKDFPAIVRQVFEDCGFIYHSRVTIWKSPVTEMQRTKALGLLHKQIKKDSAMNRQGIPDYILTMRKPGENPEHISHTDETFPCDVWQQYASPVWMDIRQSDTLQKNSAREEKDERHICPLQLEVIKLFYAAR